MEDLINDTKEAIKKRLGSPMYANFFISWIGWNWKVVYVTFFIDQNILFDSKQITKIEYIQSLYGTGNFLEWFCTISSLILLPLLSAFFILFVFNWLELIFYKKDLANKRRKTTAKIESEKEELKAEKEKFKAEEETNKAKKAAKAELTQEGIWEIEEAKIAKNNKKYVEMMNELKDFIYLHNGFINESVMVAFDQYENQENITTNTLAFVETNLLVDKDQNKVELTPKGKFFLRQFINRESQKENA